jgi:hypothetical protein
MEIVFYGYIYTDGEDEMHVQRLQEKIKLLQEYITDKTKVYFYRFNTVKKNHIIKIPFGSNQLGFFIS